MRIINKDIEMIAYFAPGKKPQPIRFRIKNDREETKTVVSIDLIDSITPERKAGVDTITYKCQGIINRTVRVFEIMYEPMNANWRLFKI